MDEHAILTICLVFIFPWASQDCSFVCVISILSFFGFSFVCSGCFKTMREKISLLIYSLKINFQTYRTPYQNCDATLEKICLLYDSNSKWLPEIRYGESFDIINAGLIVVFYPRTHTQKTNKTNFTCG